MGGIGSILAGFDGDTCQLEWTRKFNFSPDVLGNILPFNLNCINSDGSGVKDTIEDSWKEEEGEAVPSENLEKRKKRKEKKELVRNRLREGSHSLLLATRYSPWPLLHALLPLLLPSSPFAVYCDNIEVSIYVS